ncbi:N-acetyltransferase family protein [Planctomicrobium sp. SH527]|uniref:GNAT family N-acetyltransferase n=1 Tax=Planctomicrobium sp. SH527 TaxID=3448123 RepID=UPI003F5C31B8
MNVPSHQNNGHHYTIRLGREDDAPAIWQILEPVIRAGETYALPRDMTEKEAIAYWTAPDRETFVVEADRQILGTYYLRPNQLGGGSHVANCGYVTAAQARGQGIARMMCLHSLEIAMEKGFKAMQFNFVVSTNEGAVRLWKRLGFQVIGIVPNAFAHPSKGDVDALVMFRKLECSTSTQSD